MSEDVKKVSKENTEYEDEQEDIWLDKKDKKEITELDARFEAIIRQYEELQRDYFQTFDENERILLFELERLREQMVITRQVVVYRKPLRALYLEDKYYDEPSEAKMMRAMIARLEQSCKILGRENSNNTVELDRPLLKVLKETLKGKTYTPKSPPSPRTFDLATEALEQVLEKGWSQSKAAGIIAKKDGVPERKGSIQTEMSRIKKRAASRFAQAVEDFSPLLGNKNDPHE